MMETPEKPKEVEQYIFESCQNGLLRKHAHFGFDNDLDQIIANKI